MTRDETTYSVGTALSTAVQSITCPWVIASGGFAVVKHNKSGTDQYLTYSTRRRAEMALGAVKAALPDAHIHRGPLA